MCAASLPPLHPRSHLVCPPNGTRTDAVPHPSEGGKSYAPEVRDQVGRVMLSVQASDWGFRSTSQVDTTPLQFKHSAGGKIVEDATMTALPPPGIRCRPQLLAPSAVLTCALAVALRGEGRMTASRGRASWWMQGGGAARGYTTTSRGEREANGRWSPWRGMAEAAAIERRGREDRR